MKIAFAGTPVFAADILQYLIDQNHDISFILTQPDKPAGRGMHLQASAVKKIALKHNIEVYQPQSLKLSQQENSLSQQIHSLLEQIDALVVVAYGLLLPSSIVDNIYCINLHPSKLPRWRGAAPIQRAIQAGDETTAVCIMHMDKGLDTGDILYTSNSIPIEKEETGASLSKKIIQIGAQSMHEVLRNLNDYAKNKTKQSQNGVIYAQKINKEETILDINSNANMLSNTIRAFNPIASKLGIYKVYNAIAINIYNNKPNGTIISLEDGIAVSCNNGKQGLNILQLQAPNKSQMHYIDFIKTFNIQINDNLFQNVSK